VRTNTAKSQWLSYSGQTTDEWSGGIATFSNGDTATAFSASKSNGASSVIVQRLNTDGVVIWSLDIGADYAPSAGSVLVGADDKVYVTGGTKKGSTGESGENDSDIFAVALSSAGQILWYKNYGIGIHEIGSSAVLDSNGNILLEGRVSEVNDGYSFIKDVPDFYGAEFSGGWRGFQLRINPVNGTVTKAYTTGSGNSGGGPIAIDQSRNIAFVAGYTFGAVNGVNTVSNADPNGANTYLIARNETTGAVLWTRMENWMRSNIVAQESEDAIYFVDKGNFEKINGSTGQTIWSKALANTGYTLSPITGGGVLLSESESNGSLTIRRFDANGTETGSQIITHTGKLYPRAFIERGDGTIQISGSTSGEITVDEEITVVHPKQAGRDAFVLNTNSAFSVAHKATTPVVRGNSIYTIVDGPSWTQAEANSVEFGGHLVALSSAEEQKFVVDYIESIDNSRPWWWMGLGYDQSTNTFQWFNGENNTYRNWFQGNGLTYPDVSLAEGIYGYTEFTADPGRNWTDATADQGQWAVALPSSERQGVAEIPFIRRGDSAYVIIEGPTWEEAEANANALGGYLVTINDAEENKWLIDNIGHGKWIGINDKAQEGIFTWSSGETVEYTNWAQGEPNNAGGMQDYGWLQFEDGRWDDEGNIGISGIAEIKLAPNNTPTGLPTLLADFKVGEVITIDRTLIQDADNFEGWTPTYKYSWEVANDPGLTQVTPIWESLTTADATDGDENLEITDDLTGKLIRGVVSYVDGYGTQEVAESDSKAVVADEASTTIEWVRQTGSSLYEANRGVQVASDGTIWTVSGGRYLMDGQARTNGADLKIEVFTADGELTNTINAGNINQQWIDGIAGGPNRIYVAGATIVDIDGQSRYSRKDSYITAYDLTGTEQWTRFLPVTFEDGARAIDADGAGDIYIGGFTYAGISGQANGFGGADAYLAKYNEAGDLQWGAVVGGNGDNAVGGIGQVHSNGTGLVAVAGYSNQPIDGQQVGSGGFVSLFNANTGQKLWTRMNSEGVGPVYVTEGGDVFAAGGTSTPLEGESGPTDQNIYVRKYDAQGTEQWTVIQGTGGVDSPRNFAMNKNGELLLLGNTTGRIDGYTNNGGVDGVLLTINTEDGSLLNAQQWGTTGNDGTVDISIANGAAYISGSTDGAFVGQVFNGGGQDPYLLKVGAVETPLPTQRLISLPTDLTAKVGQIIEVPITINQAQDLQALDLNFAFDPALFSVPATGGLVRAGSLTSSWTFTSNLNNSTNIVKVSGFSSESLSAVSGDLAYLRLQVKGTAPRGETVLDLISASLNEDELSVELQDGSLTITAPKVSITSDLKAPIGGSIGIPITIDDANDLQSIDLVFAYDPTIFSLPASGEIVSGSTLTGDWSFAANTATPGTINISGYGTTPLEGGEGGLVNLNLKINSGVDIGSVLLDLVSASFNEGAITADLIDGTLELLPPTFQVMDVRQTPSGLALKLSEAPDLEKLNLYDGQDATVDLPDLRLTRNDGTAVEDLSLHWKAETSELYVIHTDSLTGISQSQFISGASPFQSDLLAAGDYTLVIDARSDGLVSASSGELIDGNGDGITGDAFSYSFTKGTPANLISIADTARGSGQSLGLNGIAQSNGINGLPVLVSTSSAIRSLRGTVTYDATAFNNASLLVGRDMPDDWTFETQEDLLGSLNYTASGTTAITGTDQELFRFDAVVTDDDVYGSTTLIEATVEAPEDPSLSFSSDPGIIALAYSGDTTGNGTLSSLDASRVQRVVVGLDSGFDAYDYINPVLVGDTTGNGALSSLDASRIQQQVVGLAVTSFPVLQ